MKQKMQPNRIFLHEKLALNVMNDCRTSTSVKFKTKLGFSVIDTFNAKEQTVLRAMMDLFEEKICKHNIAC